MSATRLSAAGRRASIIAAAKGVFARYSLEGARTQQIARAAGVSEALLFRHFPSKTHLYRAVLREVISDQNESFRTATTAEPSTFGLLTMIHGLVVHALEGSKASNAEGMRMVVGSLTGDGDYARLIYRRAVRLSLPRFEQALQAAHHDGGIPGKLLSPLNATAFLEHVGTMLMMAHCHPQPAVPYDDQVLVDAIMFCARGLGIEEARVGAYIADHLNEA